MRLITKGVEPIILTEYRAAGGEYDNLLAANGKDTIKTQLLAEQNNRCAYCTGSITLAKTKLEHWHPQSINPPDRTLDYHNMLAVCPGILFAGTLFHCDTSKGGTAISFDPQRPDHVNSLSYGTGSGEIICSDYALNDDLTNHEKLNLNCSALKDRRRKLLCEFRLALEKRGKAPNYAKLLTGFRAEGLPFTDIIIWWLGTRVG